MEKNGMVRIMFNVPTSLNDTIKEYSIHLGLSKTATILMLMNYGIMKITDDLKIVIKP